jgi:dienelactone hydrolase
VIAIVITVIFRLRHQSKVRWAKEDAIREIEQIYNEMKYSAAFHMALKAEKHILEDPEMVKLLSWVSRQVSIHTDPPGANIYIKEYNAIDGDWQLLGQSPIEGHRMPARTFYRWKIEKEGYETLMATAGTDIDTLYRILDEKGTIPSGMVRVIEQHIDEVMIPDFFIDKYEITNRQFKEFIDAGGYQDQAHWKFTFINEGLGLTWEEAMDEFRDMTGLHGPAGWQAGDYPNGQDDYPVTGVSWYEASAYAEFCGKNLPTVQHWEMAAGLNYESNWRFPSRLLPLSNFKGSGPVPVGNYQGVNCFGAYDMAGNVREWCWNETEKGRIIRGGAWNDAAYMYGFLGQQSPFNRSPKNGFRCVLYIDRDKIPETVFQPTEHTEQRDYYKEEPVPDAIFEVYKNQVLYDKAELEVTVDKIDKNFDDWTIEKISFNAAYGNERMIAYLFLPEETTPPYQTAIYFPGLNAVQEGSIMDRQSFNSFNFMLKTGRAVMVPVYKGTWERNDGASYDMVIPNPSYGYTEFVIKVIKDFSRSIDYLETRPDIDSNKLVYFGISWGGAFGAMIPAVEERLKAGILCNGGLGTLWGKPLPEADVFNYISRVTIPILMLNGRYDYTFPLETSIIPMYDLLGTPEKDKLLKIYETAHYLPRNEFIKETLNWLDRYLGPVKNPAH